MTGCEPVGHTIVGVDDARVGAAFRAVRIRRAWRQVDVAAKVGVSKSLVSLIERGHIGKVSVDTLRAVAGVLDVRIDIIARWRGGDLDRLTSAGHAAVRSAVAAYLTQLGWQVFPEVSFSYYGERGSIDLLAWHAGTRTLLVVEVKTEIVDVPDLLHVADRKLRLAPQIARDRGLAPLTISSWLVVAESGANRRRVAAFASLLRAVLPVETRLMQRWLRAPVGRVGGLSFFSVSNPGGVKQRIASPKRVRTRTGDRC